ncbi:MAG: quinone-dependent dihydroorotate dehydrogenase [Candidatus Doudnabacteria bacterium]|nr:quinone-dependent dihydroorotate dehydrogenase [Candidatus Doudnabacteria bacterium]
MNSLITIRNKILGAAYRNVLKPVFFAQDPEKVHDKMTQVGSFLGGNLLTRELTSLAFNYWHPKLEQNILGIDFKNPVGLAAGFDKEAKLVSILPKVGFGFEEVGSITKERYEGNSGKRLYRLPEQKALRVNYGLKSSGADSVYNHLKSIKTEFPVGISIAKTNNPKTSVVENGVEDYLYTYKKLNDLGSYVTINISCPNTCEDFPIFARAENLEVLLKAIFSVPKTKPVFVKLSPDLANENLDSILNVCLKYPVDGFVCSNLTKANKSGHEGKGGFSGKAVFEESNRLLAYVYQYTIGKKILIGCGGIFTPEDAYKKILLGASLLQLVTGMVYQGPQVISEINSGVVELLKRDGFKNISEAVGKGNI